MPPCASLASSSFSLSLSLFVCLSVDRSLSLSLSLTPCHCDVVLLQVALTVPPVAAAALLKFEEKPRWTAQELTEALKVCT